MPKKLTTTIKSKKKTKSKAKSTRRKTTKVEEPVVDASMGLELAKKSRELDNKSHNIFGDSNPNVPKEQKERRFKFKRPTITLPTFSRPNLRRPTRRGVLRFFLNTLKLILILALFTAVISTLAFLRHRQMCAYQPLTDQGKVTTLNDVNLCPDPLQNNNIFSIILNIFNLNFKGNLQVASNYNANAISEQRVDCTSQTDPICWFKSLEGELKQESGYTNILIVGSDSREAGSFDGNTDTLILASYHHQSGEVLLTSFPRDLLIEQINVYGNRDTVKINALYAWYGPENGINSLTSGIKQVIGKPVHYYVFFNFHTFTKIIDQLGGINITLPKAFEDAFPASEMGNKPCEIRASFDYRYCIVKYPKGKNKFKSIDALIYARSRYLSSDFDRARRQQEVIKAVINNALNNDKNLKDKFDFYSKVYSSITKEIVTNIKTSDITGLFKLIDKFTNNVASVVLDPTLGNFSLIYSAGNVEGFGYSLKFHDYTYKSLQNHLAQIWKYLPYYLEKPKIKVVNATGKALDGKSDVSKFINSDNPFITKQVVTDNKLAALGIRIYDMTGGKKLGSLKDLNSMIKNSLLFNPAIEGIKKSKFGEDFLIVLGK